MTNSDYSKSDLVSALKEIGLKDGDLAFIHNSMFHLGRLENCDSSKEVSRIVFEIVSNSFTLAQELYFLL